MEKWEAFLAFYPSVTPFLFRPLTLPAQAASNWLGIDKPDNSPKGVPRGDTVGQVQMPPQPIGLHLGPQFDRDMREGNMLQ
jgi:hypothetical protein